jgi:hypothetical protein
MSRTLEREMPAFRLLLVLFAVSMPLVVACSSSSSNADEEAPTAEERVTYCGDVERMRSSLLEVQDALFPLDEVAMKEARANARADFDYLEGSALQLQGGSDAADQLQADVERMLELMASPSLVTASDDIRAQTQVISNDLDALDAAGNCP